MRVFAAAALLLLAGCAGVRPEPAGLSQGMLLMQARVRGAIIPFTSDRADSAAIEQIDEHGNPLPGKVAVSGWSSGGVVYFFNLPRGRYALRSISFAARGARYEVILSSAVLRRDAVDLPAGEVAFLGSMTMDGRFPDFDVAVERALDLGMHAATPFLGWKPIERDADLRELDKGVDAETNALHTAREDLAGTQWEPFVAARLRALGAPEPAATAGLRGREVPLKKETFFSWRDTLKWGEPARAPMGLAWRRPGGEAKIAVFFTSATAEGFQGYDEAVRQMRAAASGLQDSSSYSVQVGTRAAAAARITSFRYPEEKLVGSEVAVTVTETALVADPNGMFTARLRAPRGEFEKVLPAYREFLLQLVLGPPVAVVPPSEPVLP